MPRALPTGFTDLNSQRKNIETHSTLQLTLLGDAVPIVGYYFATAIIVISGVTCQNSLRTTGAIKTSLTRSTDRVDVELQNLDDVLGIDLIKARESLYGAEVQFGRYRKDLDAGTESHKVFFTGVVAGVEVNEERVKLQLISEAYAAVSVGASRRVAPPCQWDYKDFRCASTSPELTCNKLYDHAGGCLGRHGSLLRQARFGGQIFIETKNAVKDGATNAQPPANQLLKYDSGSGVTTYELQPITKISGGVTITTDAPNKTTNLAIAGGHGLENNNVAVTTRTQINIPTYHPLKFEDDAPGAQTLLKGVFLETAVRNVVIDFGADPLGVVAADSAFAAAIASGAKISMPAGTYRITSAVTLSVVNESTAFILEGQGKNTVILFEGSGHCFVAPNGASGYWTMRDFRLVCTNLTNTGDGIRLIANSTSVNTKVTLKRVSVWNFGGGSGGWGLNADNLQSSLIDDCHFRGNISGHIRLVDPDDVDPVKEPNANVISNCLLDNSPADDFNVAALYLFNANSTRISGNTIQGNFSGSTGTLHGIYAEHCDGLVIDHHWMEDLCQGGSAVKLVNCRSVEISGYHGSGAYLWDFELSNVRSLACKALTLLNSVPHFVTSNSKGISVRASTFDHPENIIQSDTNDHIYVYADCHYHGNVNADYVEYSGTNALFTGWGEQHLLNANLIDDETGWTKNATYVSRVATGGPHGLGGYWLFDPGGSDGGAILSDILYQSVSIPDSVIPNWWTFSWDTYIVDDGNANDADRHVGIAVFATGTTEFTTIIDNQIYNVYPVGEWFRQCISVYLPAGSSRILRWRLDPAQTTRGPKTPKVRFSNFRLAPGRESQPGGHTLLSEERTNIIRGVDGLQFAARSGAAAPPSGYGALRWTGTDYEVYKSGAWTSITTGGGGSGANTALSNLASVAINASLLPGSDNTIDLGSAAKQWRDAFINRIRDTVSVVFDTPLIPPETDNTTDIGSTSKTFKDLYLHGLKMGTRVTLSADVDAQFFNGSWSGKPGTISGKYVSIEDDIFFGGAGSGVARGRFAAGSTLAVLCYNTFFNGSALRALDTAKPAFLFEQDASADEFSFWRAAATAGDQSFTKLSAIDSSGNYKINGTQVVTSRRTGWSTPTGTATRSSFDTATVTLSQLAERVKALIDDHTTHGLIGT